MSELPLVALEGNNPLGFLAALGVLDALAAADRPASLRWTDELVPHAVVTGVDDLEDLLDLLDQDRQEWVDSLVLGFPRHHPLPDAKPEPETLRAWFEAAVSTVDGRRSDADMLCAIVAEGAVDGSGKAKPTHLHFTAGQQRFLEMVRTLREGVDRARLREAVCGPWAYDSSLPSLSWDSRGERIYAVRATDPSKEQRLGVPGADWLAFRGLVFYPVREQAGSLVTTACDVAWKRSAFRWPLWRVAVGREVVFSLVADGSLVGRRARLGPPDLVERGVSCVYQAPIRRTEQGGYGSFGGPAVLASAATD